MITKVEINDNNKLSREYACEIEALSNGKSYDFKKGVNIIVGKNGCGKSTLIKLISDMCFCTDSMSSKIPEKIYKFPKLFKQDFNINSTDYDIVLNDGIDIHCDYTYTVFNYKMDYEKDSDEILSNIREVSMYMDNSISSTGEKTLNNLHYLFDKIFRSKRDEFIFPIKDLKAVLENPNNKSKKMDLLFNYYKKNRIPITKDNYSLTILMDEPDRNLDIDNIEEIFNILNFNRNDIQIIAVIHNPILIYKLAKHGNVNFIEMTEGYIETIKKVIENV